jgi:hypothetical protein
MHSTVCTDDSSQRIISVINKNAQMKQDEKTEEHEYRWLTTDMMIWSLLTG